MPTPHQALTPSFACLVMVDDQAQIVQAAPLLKRFVGQPLSNLTRWMSRTFPWYRVIPLPNEETHYAPELDEPPF